ncbi:MAG: cyclopropane-fatty-acyl-phospholipid synthase family protein [Planctomycetes bacterium]|nr:cyclopropane-fatty-acyl-phospholipid synthase family protein [Planctomycetota bacterium]
MNPRPQVAELAARPRLKSAGWFARKCRSGVNDVLARLHDGGLTIVADGERTTYGDASSPLHPTITVHDPDLWTAVALRGTVGAGESYMAGDWAADDLVAVIRLFVINRDVMESMEGGLASLARPFLRLFARKRDNTHEGSRRNIAAHYDLGNDFFRLFLDETLMYSCAVFDRADMTLHEASVAKNDRICRKLALTPADHVVEIGTGWGGFALHAAGKYGCKVTTTTISREQLDLAKARVADAGLSDKIEIVFKDYREMTGTYDALVSIEMVEAVGVNHLDTWTKTCGRLLSPRGRACVQAIVIREEMYEFALRNVDFIQRHVFPGSFIPSTAALASSFAKTTDLRLVNLEDIGPHYARTLREWRLRFLAQRDAVSALGYPPEFLRLWEFYLAYCEGGFAERVLGDVQMLLFKPRRGDEPWLP